MKGSPEIRVLDTETVTGIAAGEVVERWASVAKELVENAIDAGAGRILVEVVSSDRSIESLKVSDDGCGMNPEDVPVAFLPHATSKIRVLDDLPGCRTLGFRGEALASIAAVARVTMVTRTAGGDTGTLIGMRGGVRERLEHTGAPPGTSVEVEMLFYNTPGRRKFQKPVAYELSRISAQIEALALSRPLVSFRLVQNGRERLHTSGSGELSGAIAQLYGPALARELIPVQGRGPGFSISGYVSRPAVSRTHQHQVLVSINGRPVASKEVASAIRSAYGTLLPKDRYPVAFVALEFDPGGIDANVHPAKRIVRISGEERLLGQIRAAVSRALEAEVLIPPGDIRPSPRPGTGFSHEPVPAPAVFEPDRAGLMRTERGLRQTELVAESGVSRTVPDLKVIGYLPDLYIIASDPEGGLVIIDQHAAHERILYEQVTDRQSGSQELISPIVHRISPRESDVLAGAIPVLAAEGFVVEAFGQDSCIVRAVPVILGHPENEMVIHEILDGVLESGPVNSTREEIAKMVACRGAIKAGTSCSPEQCTRLLAQLARTKNPYSCPHGRPTMVAFSLSQLARLFKRT